MRYPTRLAAIGTFSATITLLAGSIIGAVTSRGRHRAFCVGFAVAGWIHAILVFTEWFGQGTGRILVSLYLLERLAPAFGNQLADNMAIQDPLIPNAMANFVPGSPPELYYKYIVIGQSLFTLVTGVLGGFLGAYFHARSAKSDSN